MCLSWKGGWVGHWVWMGVGCPCPPVRNDIVTPRHLLSFDSLSTVDVEAIDRSHSDGWDNTPDKIRRTEVEFYLFERNKVI